MTRLQHRSIAATLLAAIACTPDAPVAPTVGHDSAGALGLYAKAVRSTERALTLVEAHRSRAPARFRSGYDRDSRRLKEKLAQFRRASGITTADLVGPVHIQEGAGGGGQYVPKKGIIDRENTWTRVYPKDAAVIFVQTYVTWPASTIKHRTSGTIKTRGREYPIIGDWTDFGWDAFQVIPLTAVNCATAGASIAASTWHAAEWRISWANVSTDGHMTHGNDNGECPPVPPTARFTLYGGGYQAGAGNHLTIPVPSGGSAAVTLDASATMSDAPIASYSWYANGAFIGRGKSISYTVSKEHVGFTLIVRDQNGKTGTAEGSVALQYPPEDNCDGGGGGERWRIAGTLQAAQTASASDCSPPGGGGTIETNAGSVWVYDVEVWLVCSRYDFYVSFDGGRTSQYAYSTYRNCRIEYRF